MQSKDGWLSASWKTCSVDTQKEIVAFTKSPEEQEPKQTQSENKRIAAKAGNKAKEFERHAQNYMSRHFGKELTHRRNETWPKLFDLVSSDFQIAGDAKYFTMLKGKNPPPAKFSIIAEHVLMLEKTNAQIKFLVFGNDIRVAEEWLKRYKYLAGSVKFYFLKNTGEVSLLN